MLANSHEAKGDLTAFRSWFSGWPSCLVALSGGVDSSLVAYLSRLILGREHSLSVISQSSSLKRSDLSLAIEFCQRHDIRLKVIETDELSNSSYSANPTNRCFFCKSTLYGDLKRIANEEGCSVVINGQNFDDLADYRPGIQAALDFGIRSPLSELCFTKAATRALAKELQLECWDKPAAPCLSSRIPYGNPVTKLKLSQIERAESFLQTLGFPVVRVRHFLSVARIEVPIEQIDGLLKREPEIAAQFSQLGFKTIEIDREGFQSGKLNRGIK